QPRPGRREPRARARRDPASRAPAVAASGAGRVGAAGVRGRHEGTAGDVAAAATRVRSAGYLAVRGSLARDLRGGRGRGIADRARRIAAGGAAGAHRRALRPRADGMSALPDNRALDIRALEVGYPVPGGGLRRVVDGLSLSLERGAIGCLLGASGCGKTTVLRAVAGFEPVRAGSIAIDGRQVASPGLSLPPERRSVGMMFQDYALFPHLDVGDNVAFGLRGRPRADRARRVAAMLALVGLEGSARAYPHE